MFNALPIKLRLFMVEGIVRAVFFFKASYKTIALKNIYQVFPDKDNNWAKDLYSKSQSNLARFIIDFLRLSEFNNDWIKEHLEPSDPDIVKKMIELSSTKGVIYLTGHLGTFELCSLYLASAGVNLSIVARDLKQDWLNNWVKSRRSHSQQIGVISRDGAFKKLMQTIKAAKSIGLVFDQNVTRNHAVFVDFFGRPAATTFAPAYCAVEYKSPIALLAIRHKENDKYAVDMIECDCEDIYADPNLSQKDKIQLTTERMSKTFEKLLLLQPQNWFWIHRRWKTVPEGMEEDFYRG